MVSERMAADADGRVPRDEAEVRCWRGTSGREGSRRDGVHWQAVDVGPDRTCKSGGVSSFVGSLYVLHGARELRRG